MFSETLELAPGHLQHCRGDIDADNLKALLKQDFCETPRAARQIHDDRVTRNLPESPAHMIFLQGIEDPPRKPAEALAIIPFRDGDLFVVGYRIPVHSETPLSCINERTRHLSCLTVK